MEEEVFVKDNRKSISYGTDNNIAKGKIIKLTKDSWDENTIRIWITLDTGYTIAFIINKERFDKFVKQLVIEKI